MVEDMRWHVHFDSAALKVHDRGGGRVKAWGSSAPLLIPSLEGKYEQLLAPGVGNDLQQVAGVLFVQALRVAATTIGTGMMPFLGRAGAGRWGCWLDMDLFAYGCRMRACALSGLRIRAV
jgi:hypothetical protein